MQRKCGNCKWRVGVCPHYVDCFFDERHPFFKPSDKAKDLEVLDILKKKK